MGRLNGKVAVITGGARGIGLATARRFLDEGACVLLVDLRDADVSAACRDLASDKVSPFAGDVTSSADNVAMIAEATRQFGGVDILVANAGIGGDVALLVDYDEARFDAVIATNVKGPFLGLKAAIPAMMARGGGSIIITSSVAGLTGTPRLSPYSASKHAVVGLMKSAAREVAGHNIRVNSVHPSPVETQMMRDLEEGVGLETVEQAKAWFTSDIPLGRYGEPGDIANVMLFLASDDAAFMTGSVYRVDGGTTA